MKLQQIVISRACERISINQDGYKRYLGTKTFTCDNQS